MRHIVIGAGPAGVIAAETLRRMDARNAVTIVGDEPEPPYSRMALPYYLVGKIGEEGTHLRHKKGHYGNHGIEVVNDRVTRVDAAGKRLHLERNGELAFDRLLIATGATPLQPPIAGIDLPGVLNGWTLRDSREIIERTEPGSRVVLMGAGFIGCILLEALARRQLKIAVVEREERMVPRMLDETAGDLLKRWCEEKGVQVLTGTEAKAIERADSGLAVQLSDGKTLPADLVICAVGVRPNIGFLEGSGIETDQGVRVDRYLQSNCEGIYAAGDVCQGRDFSTGEYSVQAIQPTAADHGRLAAMNMCGRQVPHQGSVNMNVLDTMGLVSSSFGLWMGVKGGDCARLCDPERYRYLNLQFDGDRLVGAQALGWTQHVGVLRGLLQTRLRLGEWKDLLLKDPTRIMEAYLARTQAIGHNAEVMLS